MNFADVMARIGVYPDAPEPPCVVGYEVAGTVIGVGEGVEGLDARRARARRHECSAATPRSSRSPSATVSLLPERLSFEQGAAIPVNYATAWAALVGYGSLQPGERVLIHSAGGGVGIAAVQLARRFGAEEIYGTASPAKHERLRELGSTTCSTTSRSTAKGALPHFDVILDAIGGHSLRTSYNLLRPGGRLIAFGASAVVSGAKRNLPSALRTFARMPRFSLVKQMSESKAVIGLNMLTSVEGPRDARTVDRAVARTARRRHDRADRRRRFPFEEAGAAHDMLTAAAQYRQGRPHPLRAMALCQ